MIFRENFTPTEPSMHTGVPPYVRFGQKKNIRKSPHTHTRAREQCCVSVDRVCACAHSTIQYFVRYSAVCYSLFVAVCIVSVNCAIARPTTCYAFLLCVCVHSNRHRCERIVGIHSAVYVCVHAGIPSRIRFASTNNDEVKQQQIDRVNCCSSILEIFRLCALD